MGYAIARACINQGYNVTYICGPVNSSYQQVRGAENIRIVSTIDMLNAVKEAVTENCVLIMAAAPADYRPEVKWEKKLKKEDDPAIHLVPNPDILKSIAAMKDNKRWHDCILIGFAAETHDTEAYARKKLVEKKLDLIFLNDISKQGSGFGVDTNEITVYRNDGTHEKWNSQLKERLGYRIVNEIEDWLSKRKPAKKP